MSGIHRSKVASMIYNIYKKNGKGIGYSEGKPNEISLTTFVNALRKG